MAVPHITYILPGCYKFLTDTHLNKFVHDGSLLFGHTRKYRLLEILGQNQWIGDRSEGIAHSFVKHEISHYGNSTFYGSHITYVSNVDCYIFSFSEGYFHNLTSAVNKQESPYIYNSAVEICNINELIQRIKRAPFLEDCVETYFYIQIGRCFYAEKPDIYHISSSKNTIEANIFHKSMIYKDQKEVRIVLYPKHPINYSDEIILNIGSIDDISKIMSPIDKSILNHKNHFSFTEEDALLSLWTIYIYWKNQVPDISTADVDHMWNTHDYIMKFFAPAYGSIRFTHGIISGDIDSMITIKHSNPGFIYSSLEHFLSNYKNGQYY